MTYFQVLGRYVLPPLLGIFILSSVVLGQRPSLRRSWLDTRAALALHVLLAIVYTTPWDNYLVARGVWWYDRTLVSGLRLGWVPLEEYLFFVLQTLLTGSLTILTIRLLPGDGLLLPRPKWRASIGGAIATLWLLAMGAIFGGWVSGTYLALILIWGLLPLLLQTSFGADILLSRRRGLFIAVSLPTLYLWWVDALAIRGGTWTIHPTLSTGWAVAGLPAEEMVFFGLTNLIVACGITLALAPESQERLQRLLLRLNLPVNIPRSWNRTQRGVER